MQVAIIENNEIKVGNLKQLFPNVSFPPIDFDFTSEFAISNNIYEVKVWEEYDGKFNKLIEVPPYSKDNIVYTYKIQSKTAEEIDSEAQIELANYSLSVRNQRNQLLKDSDWTQVADAPVDKVAWASYRQELRDITSQIGFPFNVTFPTPPL